VTIREPNLVALVEEAIRLQSSGQNAEAMSAAQQANAISRNLAKDDPKAFPIVATSLRHLNRIFWQLGAIEEALTAAQEAVAIQHDLAKRNPERYTYDLARSLIDLATTLYFLGSSWNRVGDF
jgi:tetratricopeptide (TPR) repeat protein